MGGTRIFGLAAPQNAGFDSVTAAGDACDATILKLRTINSVVDNVGFRAASGKGRNAEGARILAEGNSWTDREIQRAKADSAYEGQATGNLIQGERKKSGIRQLNPPSIASSYFAPAKADGLKNPTVSLFVASITLLLLSSIGYLAHRLFPAITILLNSAALYAGFTVLHDSVHGVAHRRRVASRALGTVFGFLLTFTYPFFRAIHMRHHAHANDRTLDPDMVTASLPFAAVPFIGGFAIYGSYHYHFYRKRLWRTRAELIEVAGCELFYLSILIASLLGGWLIHLLTVWVFPLVVTLLLLVFTFDYLPHAPHDSTERLHNARAYGGRWIALLHLNQNYHLIHHLWPRIPWFRYREVCLLTRDDLLRAGARVSGVRPARAVKSPAGGRKS